MIKKIIYFLTTLLLISQTSFAQYMEPKWELCLGGSEWEVTGGVVGMDSTYWVVVHTNSDDGDIPDNHGGYDLWLIHIDNTGSLLDHRTLGGSKGEGGGTDIVKSDDSFFYICTDAQSSDGDVGNNPWGGGYWIIKMDNTGEIIWENVYGGSGVENIQNICATNDGGIVAVGISTSDDGDISNHIGGWDIWMVKIDRDGNLEWDKSLGGLGNEYNSSIIQTSDNGYLMAGVNNGQGGGNYDTVCNYHGEEGVGGGWHDYWVVKMDSIGNIEWQECYGGTYHDTPSDIVETHNGYIIVGTTLSNDGDVYGFNGVPGNQEYGADIWVIKIDKQGNLIWQNSLGGLHWESSKNIFTTSDGGFMIVGRTASDDGDVEGYHGIDTGIYDDIWFAKLDSLGNLTWQYCYGGGGKDALYRSAWQKSDWNYVICLETETDEWQCASQIYPDLRIVELSDTIVGITEIKRQAPGIKVFPNPASNKTTFENRLSNTNSIINVKLYNTNGVLVDKWQMTGNNYEYNCSQLKPGVYIYSVLVGNKLQTGKFVIAR